MQIVMIPANIAREVWPDIVHLIKLATDENDGRYEPDDVLAEVEEGNAHLWVIYNEERGQADAAITTKIIQYPRKRVCLQQFCGGTNMPEWVKQWEETVTAYAKACDCTSLELVGRRGWLRIVPDVKQAATSLIKDIT